MRPCRDSLVLLAVRYDAGFDDGNALCHTLFDDFNADLVDKEIPFKLF